MANQDVLASNWKSMRPLLKGRWHAPNDDDLKLIAGNRPTLASVLCERYAYSEEKAERDIDQFLSQLPIEAQT